MHFKWVHLLSISNERKGTSVRRHMSTEDNRGTRYLAIGKPQAQTELSTAGKLTAYGAAVSGNTEKTSCSAPAALNSYSPTGWSCKSHVKLRLAMTCSAERGCPQSNEPVTWLVVRKLRVPGDICQTSPLPFYIPTIPHLNTKNLPSVSGGLQPSWTVAAGREVPNRAVRMGLDRKSVV